MRRERTQMGEEEEGLSPAVAFQHFINAKCCCRVVAAAVAVASVAAAAASFIKNSINADTTTTSARSRVAALSFPPVQVH